MIGKSYQEDVYSSIAGANTAIVLKFQELATYSTTSPSWTKQQASHGSFLVRIVKD